MFTRLTAKTIARMRHEANFGAQIMESLTREVDEAAQHCRPDDSKLRRRISDRRRRLASLETGK